MRHQTMVFGILTVLWLSAEAVLGTPFTLSDVGLLALDYDPISAHNTSIVGRRNVPGPGVEFDIHFPGNDGLDDSILWMSHRSGGAGILANTNIIAYDTFELTFTLLSVNGTAPYENGGILNVGARINGVRRPALIDLDADSSYSTTAVSSTSIPDGDTRIEEVGFFAWEWLSNQWSPDGSTVTLLVAPTPGAVPIPEPATIGMIAFMAAGLFLRRHSRFRMMM